MRAVQNHPWKSLVLTLVLILLASWLARGPLLNEPLNRDEGEYSYIAWRMGHNELPYRDWVDQKPPAIFWAYRLALSLPLPPLSSIHLVALLFSIATAIALYFLGRRFLSPFWASCGAILFALLSNHPATEGNIANTEQFMLLPLVLSQLAFFAAAPPGKRQRYLMLLAGIFTGLAISFKQVAAPNWLFQAALFPCFIASKDRWRQTLSFAGWSAFGCLLVGGLFALYFALHHACGALLDNVLLHNLQYVQALPWSARMQRCLQALAGMAPAQLLLWGVALAGCTRLLWLREHPETLFFAGWGLAGFIGIAASGYFFTHYFQQLLPLLALLAALGGAWIEKTPGPAFLTLGIRRAVLASALFLLPLFTLLPFYCHTPEETMRRLYPEQHFDKMPELARRLAETTAPDEKVFIFGSEPELLFYAHRISATRYIFLYPLQGPYRRARQEQERTAREIEQACPAATVILVSGQLTLPGTDPFFSQWAMDYLQRGFHTDTYLVSDDQDRARLLPAAAGTPPAGERIQGTILLSNKP